VQLIIEYAKKGIRPSQIGAQLRDHHGVGRVQSVTGNKVLRVLKANGIAPALPEELYYLIKKANQPSEAPRAIEARRRWQVPAHFD
jgi:small subunit ribosomal protein S13e